MSDLLPSLSPPSLNGLAHPDRPPGRPPAPPAPVPAAPVPWAVIAGLSLAAMGSGASLRLADALLPRLAQTFQISLGQASQVITAFAVAYGLSQLLFGPLGDRYGKVRVVGWACAASAVASLLCAWAPNHPALVGARLLAGASAAAVIPLSMAWIGDTVAYEQRQSVLARFLIGQISGFAIGVAAGGYAAEHLDWRTPFYGVAGLFLLISLVLQGLRWHLPASIVAPAAASPAGLARPGLWAEFRAVLALPWARTVLLTVFCEGASVYGPFAFLAAHLHLRFGLPLSTVGGLVMWFAIGGLGFAIGSKVLVRRLGERALVHGGALVMATALLAVALAPAWWWAVPACAAYGLGFYMLHNTLQTQATQMAPERRGAAVAAFASCFFLGQSVGVGLAGILVGLIGTAWLMPIGAAGVLGVAWRFNRARRMADRLVERHADRNAGPEVKPKSF